MSDLNYRLIVDMETRGSLAPHLEKVGKAGGDLSKVKDMMGSLAGSIGGFASGLTGAFTGAVEGVASVATGLAKIAAVGVGGLVGAGVAKLNSELEITQTSIGAILNAQGMSNGMLDGMTKAGTVMKDMRTDAADLPGELKDLMSFFKLGSTAGFQSGASVVQLEKMSANAMAAAAATGVNQEQAAREFAQLLGGHSGGHNVFGSMLGFQGEASKKFNAAKGEDRLAMLETELAKFEPAIAEFGNTFDALSSSMKDNAKSVIQKATLPLFGSVKLAMSQANDWFKTHQKTVDAFTGKVGHGLEYAFELGRTKIREWTPAVMSFAQNASDEITKIWSKISPMVEKVGSVVKKEIADPALFAHMEKVGVLYGALKVGGPLAGMVGGVAGTAGKVAMAGGAEAGALGLAGGVGAAAAAVGLADVLITVGGALHVLGDETNYFHAEAMGYWTKIKVNFAAGLESLGSAFERVKPALMSIADFMGTQLLMTISGLSSAFKFLGSVFDGMTKVFESALQKANLLLSPFGVKLDLSSDPGKADSDLTKKYIDGMERAIRPEEDGGKKKAHGVAGGGGTSIQKVEIVVSSNQDPSRIARAVMDEMKNVSRNPTSSRMTRNWGSVRP